MITSDFFFSCSPNIPVFPSILSMHDAEYATVTILISTNKRSEGLHPVRWACQGVNRIWSMLLMITAVRRMNVPLIINLISKGGIPVSLLERENNTSLGGVTPDWLPLLVGRVYQPSDLCRQCGPSK